MITPSTSFNFTSGVLDPRITFARSLNTATRINGSGVLEVANADVARFDYDSVTLACNGLLIEEERTNTQTYSEDISGYTKTNVTVSTDALTAPDGAATGDKIVVSTLNTTQGLSFTAFTADGSSSYSESVFIYKTTGVGVSVTFHFRSSISSGTQYSSLVINTTTGFVSFTAAGSTSSAYTVTEVNGWWRLTISAGGIPAGSMRAHVRLISQPVSTEVGVWGCQHEVGAFATSYIPTTSAAVTRNADVATITGTNFSDWWQATRGGVLVRARPGTVSGTRPWVQFDDNTADNIIALRGNTTNPELYIRAGGADQATIDAGTISAAAYRLAGAWQAGSAAASLNSGLVVNGAPASIPAVTQMRIGSDGTNYLNGHIESIEYYDQRLLDASLQVVSSPAGYRSIIGPVMRDTIIR